MWWSVCPGTRLGILIICSSHFIITNFLILLLQDPSFWCVEWHFVAKIATSEGNKTYFRVLFYQINNGNFFNGCQISTKIMCHLKCILCGSAATHLLGLWVRILPGAWMSVSCECCVSSGRGLCVGLITHPEESYRVWCVWVLSWILSNEEASAH